ncbi:hypothetical protein [Olivibacter sp. XZL3]|uniref:hypothetical protein n=1 Tax=Olivibacter sp. XZL3 TaxID=1735116 RepID=UPI001064F1EA|nr:hypothetical protein [Olivibacter sp. XZL3]
MTFEDFFIKKRIDLRQLEKAEPQLYKEFKSHFELMGEKSFDHTKKFWFNRLRKSFHLKEDVAVPQPVISTSPLDENKAIAAAESPQAVKPVGFKPRFKSGQTNRIKEEGAEDKSLKDDDGSAAAEQDTPKAKKPTGFKPRFKAGTTNKETTSDQQEKPLPSPQDSQGTEQENNIEQSTTTASTGVSKPTGFKPRFKAGVTGKTTTESQAPEQTAPQQPEKGDNDSPKASKPSGFKPRFKAGATKTTPPTGEDAGNKEQDVPKQSPDTVKPSLEEEGETKEVAKPLGFKPRFKAGATKTAPPTGEDGGNKEQDVPKQSPDTVKPSLEEEGETKEVTKPLGFKPRFKPGMKKDNAADNND